jgi:hypothetical protein
MGESTLNFLSDMGSQMEFDLQFPLAITDDSITNLPVNKT